MDIKTLQPRKNMKQHEYLPRSRSATGPSLNQGLKATPEVAELWTELSKEETNVNEASIQQSFVYHVNKTLARSALNIDQFAAYQANALTLKDVLLDRWNATQLHHTDLVPKRVYYMSLEFLIGRSMDNAMLNLGMKSKFKDAIGKLGFNIEDLIGDEMDAALGNGGLGRLAACFMDSLSTLDYPAWGYGIRYTYGIFQQRILDGYQKEYPDYWLTFGNPWEIQRLDVAYEVGFGGSVKSSKGTNGKAGWIWDPAQKVTAVAYDYPIPGYGTKNCINIRLWSAKPTVEFDFASFNDGNYNKAVEEQYNAENITACLYPNDNHPGGKELRLKQQYLFVSATLRDIIRRFKKTGDPWIEFPNQVAIQLNDTHPTLGIVELQRILIDEEFLSYDDAWEIVTKTYSYTNHTVLPEALEKWSIDLMEELLPRHLMIIYDINLFFLQKVEKKFPGDRDRLRRMSIIEEGSAKCIRMAFLAVVGSHHVNGVAALHSELVKTQLFSDFVEYFGDEKFTNVTNGITPRRWLNQANPMLGELITKTLGDTKWLKDLSLIAAVKQKADDPDFQDEWMTIKRLRKKILAEYIEVACGVVVNPNALFDIQCKRIHEYKRQFMNILGVIHRYEQLLKMSDAQLKEQVPKVVIFAGKSAPGYYIAKLVIKLINNVAGVVNEDEKTNHWLKLVFIPNYNVSLAEIIVPASDISQHISTAGTEASGTSNMKFVLNGGLIVGTVDGANIEIGEETGPENIFLFGVLTPEVEDIRHRQTYRADFRPSQKLVSVLDSISRGLYGDAIIFQSLLDTLKKDVYLVHTDFDEYLETLEKVNKAFVDEKMWAKKSILAAMSMGKFSSDRSIEEYAKRIWNLEKCHPK